MSHEDLGDQLGALARASEGHDEAPPVRQSESQRPASPGAPSASSAANAPAGKPLAHDEHHDEHDEYIAAEVDDESGSEVAEAPIHFHPSVGQPAPMYRPLPRKTKKNSELKAIAAPILMTVGVMLLIPAFWAVLVLTGAGVPMSDREDASSMAKVMLLCWPVALALVIPAVFMFVQISADKKRK